MEKEGVRPEIYITFVRVGNIRRNSCLRLPRERDSAALQSSSYFTSGFILSDWRWCPHGLEFEFTRLRATRKQPADTTPLE